MASTMNTCSDDIEGIDPGYDPVDNYVSVEVEC